VCNSKKTNCLHREQDESTQKVDSQLYWQDIEEGGRRLIKWRERQVRGERRQRIRRQREIRENKRRRGSNNDKEEGKKKRHLGSTRK
jgi:hypothetical protein